MMPERPARAPPTIQIVVMTRSTSMPDEAASAGLSDTARVALPSRVRWTASGDDHEDHDAHHGDVERLGGDADRADVPQLAGRDARVLVVVGAEEVLVDVPQEDRQTDADDHHGDEAGALAAQRFPEQSVVGQAEGAGQDHGDHGGREERPAPLVLEQERRQGAERDELAVGEVGEARRAEHQGQAERGEGEQQAEEDAVDAALTDLGEQADRVVGRRADRVADADVGVGLDRDLVARSSWDPGAPRPWATCRCRS